ncbi:PREDICTED: uncharacterized protein LOC108761266 [Trachymyrmex cornetzi]|uniref:uncharacterized protein LOC108761266 n=1 Tax=Trachymyrmex cornetzi TaxID=471704 RepID=UPI00084F4F80|nr:PREDICTED: uncharacterized protein LOC108761266 [Trachymyrmex cornetzi]
MGNYNRAEKCVSKGCPQVSILGPELRNLVFDGLLRLLEARECDCFAYADDLLVLIKGNSRREVESSRQVITDCIMEWFERVFLAIITYGAGAWEDLEKKRHIRILMSTQRYALLSITRTYRIDSTEAVQVLAGVEPLDLTLKCRALIYRAVKQEKIEFGEFASNPVMTPAQISKGLRRAIITEWNNRWSNRIREG